MTPNMKIWLESIRSITFPEHMVDDATQFACFTDRIYAVNPKFPPMVYVVADRGWSKIDFSQPPDKLMPRYREGCEFVKEIKS